MDGRLLITLHRSNSVEIILASTLIPVQLRSEAGPARISYYIPLEAFFSPWHVGA